MRLGDMMDVSELHRLIKERFITRRNHPTLSLAILNYTNECMFQNVWTPEIQHCRGLIVNPIASHDLCGDCEVVARPFHKFFGLNHPGQLDYDEANLPAVIPTVTEKMDGWFGIMWDVQGSHQHFYGVASRGSFDSPGALFATKKLEKLVKYGAVEEFPKGYSPVFEIIFKAGKIVVDYPFEGLVLTGCVNIETGEELPYDELQKVWAKIAGYAADNRPWIRLVKAHRMTLQECINSNKENFEGYVLSYDRPGTWPIKVKVKLDDYKRLHRLITGVTPQQIWKSLHDPMAPWLGGEVPEHFRTWARKWRDELYSKFHSGLEDAISLSRSAWIVDAGSKKLQFERLHEVDPKLANISMMLIESKIHEAYQAIWSDIRPHGRESDVFYREGQGE